MKTRECGIFCWEMAGKGRMSTELPRPTAALPTRLHPWDAPSACCMPASCPLFGKLCHLPDGKLPLRSSLSHFPPCEFLPHFGPSGLCFNLSAHLSHSADTLAECLWCRVTSQCTICSHLLVASPRAVHSPLTDSRRGHRLPVASL